LINRTRKRPSGARPKSRTTKVKLAANKYVETQEEYDSSSRTTKRIDKGQVFLWEDPEPVSMAAKGRPTEHGITISLVYTPPNFRNRGYATSCVACLCGELLESGFRYCTLYTDLSNPVSNSVYKRIGFTEVCDSVDHTFEDAPGTTG
jgi:hypothetical protein